MNGIHALWFGSIGASATLAALVGLVWAKNRSDGANLAFVALAASFIVTALFELALMRASTALEFGALYRWSQVPVFFIYATMALFLYLYFGAAHAWLGALAVGARTVVLVVNFVRFPNVTYSPDTVLREIEFLGQPVVTAVGEISPWMGVARLSSLLLLAYIAAVSVATWRSGGDAERRRAAVVGGSLFVLLLGAALQAALVQNGLVDAPYVVSLFFLAAVATMGAQLSHDVVRSAEVTRRLGESETLLQSIVGAAMDAILAVDGANRVVLCNPAAEAMFGRPAADLVGRSLPDLAPADHAAAWRRLVDTAGAEGKTSSSLTGRRAGGETFPAEVSTARTTLSDRTLSTLVVRDASDRLAAEQAARESRAEITYLSRVALVTELSGSLAHELNQPLGTILSNAQAVRRLLGERDLDRGELLEIVADIISEDQRAADIIERLRELLVHDVEPRMQSVDLGEVTRQMVRLTRREREDRGIVLEMEIDGDLLQVSGDRVQIEQVVLNLLMNALDAMAERDGPRVLTIRVDSRDGDGVRATVSDTGAGIAADVEERLFQPFVTTKATGLGMGLAISSTIVNAHGGTIFARNNDGPGATFGFVLPAGWHAR